MIPTGSRCQKTVYERKSPLKANLVSELISHSCIFSPPLSFFISGADPVTSPINLRFFSDSPFNKITDFQCRQRGGSNSCQKRQPQLHACGLISLLYRWTKFWPRLWPVMVIIHQLVDIECFQESLNRVMRSLQRALMNAKLSSLSLLPSGRLTVPGVNKKAHTTYSHAKTQMITVSAPHCPLRSLPYGYKRSTYGSVHVVFPVRKALFGCAYGSS